VQQHQPQPGNGMPPAPASSKSNNGNQHQQYQHHMKESDDESVEIEVKFQPPTSSADYNTNMEVPSSATATSYQLSSKLRSALSAPEGGGERCTGPVDLDALFEEDFVDDDSLFSDDDLEGGDQSHLEDPGPGITYFNNPNRRLLDNDASLIPGSPFSKPPNQASNRPNEPLAIAKYASTVASVLTMGWVAFLLFAAIWNYQSVGRIIVEVILSLFAFFGLFWNSYFIVSSIFKCFIPRKAFTSNTKYCSIIPENKRPESDWLDVTIQIPVYKESLKEVMMPTLQSCMKARDYYRTHATNHGIPIRCNIVICDDGMMAFLRDNFPAAEMLWKNINETHGRVIKLSKLLKRVPRASRRHLKGLRSQSVYEVFHRMLFYYHFDIGFVARSTVDRRGKFKKASNLNSHLRLALGAAQMAAASEKDGGAPMTFEEALLAESHNEDGSRYIMFGNDIKLGDLICINDADARMAETVILKTVPEFLNDRTLGFTQHATKTMNEQRGESYFTNMLTVYTDALYQGHFLLSSILGCHPPLVGHSIFLRTEAVKQCGRMRTLRKAQRWLRNIGLPFLPVDQVGFSNLQAENRTEYWSENHVSEDFELMIHLYNLGFNGRYCAYPDCEFQEGITRTFDEEAGRHRKFALGAHELVFNPFQDMLGHGVFTPLFKTFLQCDIPSYYKVFLAAYLCSYASGGCYLIVFLAASVARILDAKDIGSLYMFSPAGVIILNFIIYYVVGYFTFIISLLRMHYINNKLLFPEYRKKWCGATYLVFVMLRYCFVFQFLFYNVATLTFYFLGSMDHLLSRPGVVSATNKDSITYSRCTALWEVIKFNSSSYCIAIIVAAAAYAVVLADANWDPTNFPPPNFLNDMLFAAPAFFLAILTFIVPIILNPFVLGWPFLCKPKPKKPQPKKKVKKDPLGREVVDITTFMNNAEELQEEIERVQGKPDVELGSLSTRDLRSHGSPNVTPRRTVDKIFLQAKKDEDKRKRTIKSDGLMYSIPEFFDERAAARNGTSKPATGARTDAAGFPIPNSHTLGTTASGGNNSRPSSRNRTRRDHPQSFDI